MQPAIALRRLRALVSRWAGTVETDSWGHPNWKVGSRQFASFDSYDGVASICFKATLPVQAKLAARKHFRLAPYAASRGWVCRTLEEPLDWAELAALIRKAYALVDPLGDSTQRVNSGKRARMKPGPRHGKPRSRSRRVTKRA